MAMAVGCGITFYDSAFRYGVLEAKATAVHEIAHVWDFKTGSQASSQLGNYAAKERMPSQYAADSSAPTEHWAESVAAWAYPNYGDSPQYWLESRHRDYVEAVAKGRLPLVVLFSVILGHR